MSGSVRPQRWQPTRLPRPWDSPGKNTGVGRHFLLQCMKVKSESEVAQSCLTFSDPVDCSLPGSSVHGIFQARVLVAIAFSVMPEHNMTNIFRGRTHVKRWFECDNQLMSHCHLNTTTVLIVFHYLSFSDEKCVIFGSEQWNAFL